MFDTCLMIRDVVQSLFFRLVVEVPSGLFLTKSSNFLLVSPKLFVIFSFGRRRPPQKKKSKPQRTKKAMIQKWWSPGSSILTKIPLIMPKSYSTYLSANVLHKAKAKYHHCFLAVVIHGELRLARSNTYFVHYH